MSGRLSLSRWVRWLLSSLAAFVLIALLLSAWARFEFGSLSDALDYCIKGECLVADVVDLGELTWASVQNAPVSVRSASVVIRNLSNTPATIMGENDVLVYES